MKIGQINAAIYSIKKAIDLKPSQEAYNSLGLLLARIGQYDEAVESYKKAIDLGPKSAAIAYYNLGNTQRARKLPEEAIRCYQKAMELDPKYATPHSGLGVALAETGRFEEAIQSHQKAIDLSPGEPIFRQNLACGLVLAAAGKSEKGRIPEEKEKSTLRQQALKALREAKDLWSKQLEKSASRSTAKAALQQIQTDPDLASIRDPEALKKLPPEEQKAFAQVWAEVDALLKPATATPAKEIKP